jgi:hypothetical protein
MHSHLHPFVHAACVDDDLVLLDEAADAYFCLPGAAEAFSGADPALLDDLVGVGLASPDPGSEPRSPPPPLPVFDLRHGGRASPRTGDWLRLIAAVGDVAVHYRARSFRYILDHARAGQARTVGRGDPAELQRLCGVFAEAVPWLPAPGKCLVRCFLLLSYLRRAGFDATWVIGVRTWPFQAHCWLQHGEAALEDAPERLAAYTPILAV